MPNIKIADIICTQDRDPGDITSLANSIARLGLLQPIILRGTEDNKYTVIDGRRRFAAVQTLGWTVLPESAYTFSSTFDDQSVIAHAANVERKNLSPSEEVRQLAAMADTHSVQYLAELFGRTPGWIARRLKIAALTSKWLRVLDDPEKAPLWPLDKLALIARQPEAVQKKLSWTIDRNDNWSAKEISDRIKEYNRQISVATFDTADCRKCKNNSATQELLFDDTEAKDGICLNTNCWIKKSLEAVKKTLKDEKLIPIEGKNSGWSDPDTKFAKSVKADCEYQFKEIRAPKKGETANAIIVSGDGIGRRVFAKKWPYNEKKTGGALSAEKQKPKTLKEREQELAQKRNKCALKLLLEFINKDYDQKAWMAKIPEAEKLPDLLLVLHLYGCDGIYTQDFRVRLKPGDIREADIEEVRRKAYQMALCKIRIHLKSETEETLARLNPDAGPAIAKLLRIEPNWEDAKRQSLIDVKEPMSLVEARAKAKSKKG